MSIRLNSTNRGALKKLARDIVMADTTGYEEIEKMKVELGQEALALVQKTFPAEDMKVLKKYEITELHNNFMFVAHNTSDFFDVDLYDSNEKKVEVAMPRFAFRAGKVRADKKLTELYYNYKVAINKFNNALNEKLNKYFQVIDHFKTYEKLVEVWPEAARISNEFVDNLPAAISDDTIAMIKADSERRLSSGDSKKK